MADKYKTSGISFSGSFLAETMGLWNMWNSVLLSVICLPDDFLKCKWCNSDCCRFPIHCKNASVWTKEQRSRFVWYISQTVHSPCMCSRCWRALRQSFSETQSWDFSLQFCPFCYLYAIDSLKFTPLLDQLKSFTFSFSWGMGVAVVKLWLSLSWSIFT